jgi:RNA polymerase sigma-70 factor (ECF subfamily)
LFVDKPELLRAFRAGERDALTAVYWGYVDAVAQVVRHGARLTADAAVSGAPRGDWADLVQETFSRAFSERARLAYDGLRPYRPYLLTICRNLLADHARKRGRELPSDFDGEALEAAAGSSEDAGEALPPAQLAVVERYLAGLDARLAGVYQQRYITGATQEEAARALGLTRQRVRTLEDKLRRGLRRALAKSED